MQQCNKNYIMGPFGTLETTLYIVGAVFMIITIFMALSRKKEHDDEDITD